MSEKLVTYANPRNRPAAPARPLDPVLPRYVYDDNAREIGGKPVFEQDGERVVLLSNNEAQFYIDQASIGDKPLGRRSARATEVIEQATGVAEPDHKKRK
jgi:hypothetical protein